ncbi:MAG: hypothetical protein ACFCA4_04855 [Cyanophyceae cyanobacterium]
METSRAVKSTVKNYASKQGQWSKEKAWKIRFVAFVLVVFGFGLILEPALTIQAMTGGLINITSDRLYETWRQQQLWGGFGISAVGIAAVLLCWSDIRRQSQALVFLPPVAHSFVKYGDLSADTAIDRLRHDGDQVFQVAPEPKTTLEIAGGIAGTCTFLTLVKWLALWHAHIHAWIIFLGPISLFVWAFAWLAWRVNLMQAWASYHHRAKREGPFFCQVCQHPLAPMPSEQLELYLSPREQKLAEVKSVQWRAHYCAQCYPELDNPAFSEPLLPTAGADAGAKPEAPSLERPFHLFALDQSRLNFEVCPSCDEKALKRTIKILKEATTEREGMMETTLECKMCDHIDMSHRVIPMKPKTAD